MLLKRTKLSAINLLVSVAVVISACDGDGDRGNFEETNSAPEETNNVPIIDIQEVVTALEDQEFSLALNANDEDGDELAYSGENLPQWLSLNSTSGVLSGIPAEEDIGRIDGVTITVTDGTETISDTFTLEVLGTETIVISGRTSGVILANADVTVDFREQIEETTTDNMISPLSFTAGNIETTTDEVGLFTFTLVLIEDNFRGDEILDVNIRGAGELDHVEFVSQIGDIDFVLGLADDGQLNDMALTRLSISPITTALALMSEEINGGLITDWDLLQSIEMELESNDIIDTANLITLLSDENTEIGEDQTILEELRNSAESIDEELSLLLGLNNLIDENGNLLEFAESQINIIEDLFSNRIFLNQANIRPLLDRPLIWANAFVRGTHPGDFQDVIEFNGPGVGIYNQNSLDDTVGSNFNWSVNDNGALVIESTAESRFTSPEPIFLRDLRSVGFSEEIAAFLEVEALGALDPEITEEVIEINVISINEFSATLSVVHELSVNVNRELIELGFEGELQTITMQGALAGPRLALFNSNLEFTPDTFASNQWALPVLDGLDESLGNSDTSRSSHDLYEFFEDGTTSSGLLGGSAAVWQIMDGRLVFDNGIAEFEITPLIETSDELYVLVKRTGPDGSIATTADDIAQVMGDNINQFGEDFILSAPSQESAPIWYSGFTFLSRPQDFIEEGLPNFQFLFGYAFPNGGSNIVTRIASNFDFEGCLTDQSQSCVNRVDERTINIVNDEITIGLQDDNNSFFSRRDRVWNVLSYDTERNRAVVLERVLVMIGEGPIRFLTRPRINILQQRDLASDYPEEYRDDPLLF